MPDVTSTGNIDFETRGFSFLGYSGRKQALIFSGTTLPTTLEVGVLNDQKVFVPFTAGGVTVLPTTILVEAVPTGGLVLNVDGGSPNFNVSSGGKGGALTQ